MQSANVAIGQDCGQFFAAFDQIKADNSPLSDTGLTVFQVESLLGPPSTISSGVGHNLYTYNVGRCIAEIEFANGRSVRKTFAIAASPQAAQPLPKPPPQTFLVWALAIIAAILVIALVWNILRNRRSSYEAELERRWTIEGPPRELRPVEPRLSHTAALYREPQDRTPQQPPKRTEHPRPWHEAS